jgi:hypothetical protein
MSEAIRPATTRFDSERRAVLAAVADLLIPGADGMPSASEAGVAGRWLDEVLHLRPDFGPPLAAVLDQLNGADPEAALAGLRTAQPAGFGVLAEVVAGGYFLNPKVRSAIGYPGQRAVPIVPDEPPDYEQDGLIASVISRGPIYRPTR